MKYWLKESSLKKFSAVSFTFLNIHHVDIEFNKVALNWISHVKQAGLTPGSVFIQWLSLIIIFRGNWTKF